ncbi:MAG: hypothetical protein EHM61_05090 [Acidobacteria bacterium]|nr:MAG: hypothetical protein EHM61_05090 [Acidobacteriota bacterium]
MSRWTLVGYSLLKDLNDRKDLKDITSLSVVEVFGVLGVLEVLQSFRSNRKPARGPIKGDEQVMGRLKFFLILALMGLVLVAVGALVAGQTPEAASKSKPDQSIHGTVMDADGLPIPGATVELKGTLIRTETDDQGTFVFSGLPAGTWTVVASSPSFQTSETNVSLITGQHLKLDIKLDVAPLDYEVTVRSDVPKLMEASESIGVVSLSPVQIATLPSLGEKDIFRSIQLMPGVSASNEASAGLFVRGGTPDQNLVLFDGFTVYNVDHFYGIFSAFNAQAVRTSPCTRAASSPSTAAGFRALSNWTVAAAIARKLPSAEERAFSATTAI